MKAANRTWGIAISGILSGASIVALPFLFGLSTSIQAHDSAISAMKTQIAGQEKKIDEMAADIKTILAELRKHP